MVSVSVSEKDKSAKPFTAGSSAPRNPTWRSLPSCVKETLLFLNKPFFTASRNSGTTCLAFAISRSPVTFRFSIQPYAGSLVFGCPITKGASETEGS